MHLIVATQRLGFEDHAGTAGSNGPQVDRSRHLFDGLPGGVGQELVKCDQNPLVPARVLLLLGQRLFLCGALILRLKCSNLT